jgi:hypothetical protein
MKLKGRENSYAAMNVKGRESSYSAMNARKSVAKECIKLYDSPVARECVYDSPDIDDQYIIDQGHEYLPRQFNVIDSLAKTKA